MRGVIGRSKVKMWDIIYFSDPLARRLNYQPVQYSVPLPNFASALGAPAKEKLLLSESFTDKSGETSIRSLESGFKAVLPAEKPVTIAD
jgi:hypothetical protein